MRPGWLLPFIVLGFSVLLSDPVCADFKAGMDAYKQGDYATALKEWEPLAKQGNASAQTNMGVLYQHGYGVSGDRQEAMRWYRLAAEQGHVTAQYNLGLMYHHGGGVPKDNVQAHMWCTLAVAGGYTRAGECRDKVAKRMTPAQLAEAQRLAHEWEAKHKSDSSTMD